MLDFSDRTRTGISILTSAADLLWILNIRHMTELHEICRSPEVEAQKLGKNRSGNWSVQIDLMI